MPEPFVCMVLRKSRHPEEMADPDALHKHRAALAALSAADGIAVPPENVVEEVISGECLAARPAFRALLTRWQRLPPGTGGVVYCVEADRISRGELSERGLIYDAIRRAGLFIRTPGGWLDPRDPDQNLLLEVKGSLARHELERFKQRVRDARTRMLAEARVQTGRVPRGYLWDRAARNEDGSRGKVVTDPEWFPIVKEWCQLGFHLSARQIAARYGVHHRTVRHTLTNPFLCGWPAMRHPASRRPLPRDQWRWPERAGDWEPAISRADWERLQLAIEARRTIGVRKGVSAGWCRDVLAINGQRSIVLSSCRWKSGKVPLYQVSRPRVLYVPQALIHDYAASEIETLFSRPQSLAALRSAAPVPEMPVAPRETPSRSIYEVLSGLRADLERLQEREMAEEDEERRRVWERLGKKKADEIRRLKREAALPPAPDDALALEALAVLLEAVGNDFGLYWQSVTDDERRGIVNAVFVSIEATVIPAASPHHWQRSVSGTLREWAIQAMG